ncbi:MAG: VWA domain-containing protein [Proteobacteria bacterium]|nr:VWA domain-containing protein [Pseudomonadota bacterium]
MTTFITSKKPSLLALCLLVGLWGSAWGCSNDSKSNDTGDDVQDTANNNGTNNNPNDTLYDGPKNNANNGTNSNNSKPGGPTDFEVCGEVSSNLTQVATRVMILLDRSRSMQTANKWDQALAAIEDMVTEFDAQIAFGLDVFAADSSGRNALCVMGDEVLIDVVLDNADTILTRLDRIRPESATPLYLGMNNFTDTRYAPVFLNRAGSSYLVIISDGMDTCGTDGVFDVNQGATNANFADVTNALKDRDVKSIVIGFGDEADPDQLNAIAELGGSQFTEFINAADGAQLSSALRQIAETVVVSCQFEVGTFDDEDGVDLSLANVTFDGLPIPRDDKCAAKIGWTWANDERTVIQFCEAACTQLESEGVENIRVQLACSADDVIMIIN